MSCDFTQRSFLRPLNGNSPSPLVSGREGQQTNRCGANLCSVPEHRFPDLTMASFKAEDVFIFLLREKGNQHCFPVCKIYSCPNTHGERDSLIL